MPEYKVIKTQIRGLLIIEPAVEGGNAESMLEECSKPEMLEMGIDAEFVYTDHIKVARGVLSGLHFQREQTQGKLVHVTSGSVLYVTVDLRPDSRTYGAPWAVEISAENQRALWVPEQFAHGYLTLESKNEITLNCTNPENLKSLAGIAWNDPIICIDWEFERYDIDEKYLKVSDRDKRLPTFRSWNPKTLWEQPEY